MNKQIQNSSYRAMEGGFECILYVKSWPLTMKLLKHLQDTENYITNP